MEHLREIFDEADIYYVELVAPQEIRLRRNATENRLKHKPSKRNLEWSNEMIIELIWKIVLKAMTVKYHMIIMLKLTIQLFQQQIRQKSFRKGLACKAGSKKGPIISVLNFICLIIFC